MKHGKKRRDQGDSIEQTCGKIHNQPDDQDFMKQIKELIKIIGSVPTELRGGMDGHSGLLIKQAKF